ncbi:uncharacterized protein PFL1_01245 [Pseudozyma flocculosa PF-1]|uniref:NmrA-like domain-containing protein n=1 Tax=Pseudozyma flocculosa TaxID=84751 RepID=A0A5C3EV42_9BASI|nr:uncharacterized protein PFL1_01245 [Pseudozyma flocculosa PF-1]EPQ31056.1 hypothetical protein PFL1_01245 [Pseudozyma flocculosa PF-1]SPO35902.1 uncharacterized protein PSFLO_01373 [Pseudozyma flocculosa]
MPSPTYSKIAIAGVGHIGKPIAEALLSANLDVKILSRTSAAKPGLEAAKVVAIDYNDASGLAAALDGVEVVISTLGGGAALDGDQIQLADAAKRAGVRLFVPSDFSTDMDLIPRDDAGRLPAFWRGKGVAYDHLERIGLPYLRIVNNAFGDYLYSPFIGFDFDRRTVQVVGDLDRRLVVSAERDVGAFLAHVLTTLPAEQLENRALRLQSFKTTWRHAIQAAERARGIELRVENVSIADAKAKADDKDTDPFTAAAYIVRWAIAAGAGDFEVDNDAVGFKPSVTSLEQLL